MAFISPGDAVMSVGRSIGRNFSVVSFLPALMLVLWSYGLVASDAWSGASCPHRRQAPCLEHVQQALAHWSLAKVTGLIVVALAVALFLHPLQFATTRLLEGYWGASSLSVTLMTARVLHYRRKSRALEVVASDAWQLRRSQSAREHKRRYEDDPATRSEGNPADWTQDEAAKMDRVLLESVYGDQLLGLYLTEQQATARRNGAFPIYNRRVMPTRLGNALRRFEDAAGAQYNLNALTVMPMLQLVMPERHLDYLTDARQGMDTAIRLCLVSMLACVLSVAFLLRDGFWLLVALVPYALAYVAYLGSVSAAQGYGVVVERLMDLNRFALYDKLRVPLPANAEEERRRNGQLMVFLNPYDTGSRNASFEYRHDALSPGHGGTGPLGRSAAATDNKA